VLLGEPGAGKTTAFQMESEATGGRLVRISEFISTTPSEDPECETLFLDGLDETRQGESSRGVLHQVRALLEQVGRPKFRVACRAADWFGASDVADFEAASRSGHLDVLQLEPLANEDVHTLLHENHGIADSDSFINNAERRGIGPLLGNPQMLALLAAAIRGNHWPATRQKTYELACSELAKEPNKRHRDAARHRSVVVDQVLDAAGQLCSVLLLAGGVGVALDTDASGGGFFSLDDLAPPDPPAARRALGSMLFWSDGEERVVPSHRTVAEFLAARWLGHRLERKGLPLARLLRLLVSADGRAVTSLRGLYAWLALECPSARARLIRDDPVTVVLYGDTAPMPVDDKQRILDGLRREATRYPAFLLRETRAHALGELAAPELVESLRAPLRSPAADESGQAYASCILDILNGAAVAAELEPELLAVVRDDSWPSRIRWRGLRVWLGSNHDPKPAVALLDDICAGRVVDRDDELIGLLLEKLYPAEIGPEDLLVALHTPREPAWVGLYSAFWAGLPCDAPTEHVPVLLDGLVGRPEVGSEATLSPHLSHAVGELLVRGIEEWGDEVENERLFEWLGIGAGLYGQIEREEQQKKAISDWLGARPAQYKGLLELCFSRCNDHERPIRCLQLYSDRLHDATPPIDLGAWHLAQADRTRNEDLAREHLCKAVQAVWTSGRDESLSIESLEKWAAEHPQREDWLEPLLRCDLPSDRFDDLRENRERKRRRTEDKRERTDRLRPHLAEVATGTARVDVMHELAGVYENRYANTIADTPAERFARYCDNSDEALGAAEAGFRRCPERPDLPSVEEIIALEVKQRAHVIRLPCLVGMELKWRDGVDVAHALSDDVLSRMVAFRLTDGMGLAPEWYVHLAEHRPELVAEVLVPYARAALRAKLEHVDGICPLSRDPRYHAVAKRAAPRLLAAFPGRARVAQLQYLNVLLKAALRVAPDELAALLDTKLAMTSIKGPQRVYWLAAATVLDPHRYDDHLWKQVGRSESLVAHVSRFFSREPGQPSLELDLPAATVGRLIEHLAPHATFELPLGSYWVSPALERGDQIRALVRHLTELATLEAESEIERLLGLSSLAKLRPGLEAARDELKQRRRENEFRFLSPTAVAQVVANEEPTDAADLAALVVDHLDGIAQELRRENDDGWRAFWNIRRQRDPKPRDENLCRDALLSRLRPRLRPFGVDCNPEGDYANDKRADLCVSYRGNLDLPIELKRDRSSQLWTTLREQLVDKYVIAMNTSGFGIYLVIWFGGEGMPRPLDGGRKPTSPEDLRHRLEAQLTPAEQQRISVRVVDVSWPASAPGRQAV
jgi:hypothetical protein